MPNNASPATWIERAKRRWREFKAAPVGQRFQQVHRRRQQARRSPWRKALFLGAGVLLMIVGVVLLFVPGPGLLVLFAGAALVARESLRFCQALDWAELRLRPLCDWGLNAWQGSPFWWKAMLVLLTAAVLGGVGYAAWVWLEL